MKRVGLIDIAALVALIASYLVVRRRNAHVALRDARLEAERLERHRRDPFRHTRHPHPSSLPVAYR